LEKTNPEIFYIRGGVRRNSDSLALVKSLAQNEHIVQLHGNDKGQTVLMTYWSITSGDSSVNHQFYETASLTSGGYDALVAAEKNYYNSSLR